METKSPLESLFFIPPAPDLKEAFLNLVTQNLTIAKKDTMICWEGVSRVAVSLQLDGILEVLGQGKMSGSKQATAWTRQQRDQGEVVLALFEKHAVAKLKLILTEKEGATSETPLPNLNLAIAFLEGMYEAALVIVREAVSPPQRKTRLPASVPPRPGDIA